MNVSIFTKNKDNFSKNGAFSQVIFVYYCLNKIDNINCRVYTQNGIQIYKGIETYNDTEKLFREDVIICLNGSIGSETDLQKIKENNVKLIFYNCGNLYYVFQEDILFNKHNYINNDNIKNITYYDKIISIPNYEKYKQFYKSIFYINDVETCPYVWYNTLVDDWMKENKTSIFYDPFINISKTKFIVICEPNLQITKTCLVPLLICNELYKSDFKNIKIVCLCKPKYMRNLRKLINHLDIFKNNLIEFYDRMVFYGVINNLKQKNIDFCVLSHHKDNPLNFLHLETLYLKYGLIHNSEKCSDAGYYYEKIPTAVNQIKNCFINHAKNIKQYNNKTIKLLHKFSPFNKENQNGYEKLITR